MPNARALCLLILNAKCLAADSMKSREPRQSVMIPARLRDDAAWSDVSIRNVSGHGMMLHMSRPPVRGSYVELRRSDVVIVARVMWADGDRCGLRTQQRIDVQQLATAHTAPIEQDGQIERRAARRGPDTAAMAAAAAMIGHRLQHASVSLFGGAMVLALGYAAYVAMSRPAAAILAAMHS